MVSQITHNFRTTFASLLAGKLYNFRRRSLWRYLLGALLLSLVWPELVSSFWPTLLVLAAGLVGLGLLVVVASSYALQQQRFEAEVTFRADSLLVHPASGAPPQTHPWQWVRQASETNQRFFLVVKPFPRLILLLDKHRLTDEEVVTFRTWLAARQNG